MTDDQLAAVRSKSIGFVFQGFNLLARTSAERNIELPLIYTGERKRTTPAHALLEAVGLPKRGQPHAQLSFPEASSSAWPSRGRW